MEAFAEFFEVEVEDGGEVEGQNLGNDEAADDDEAKGSSTFCGHAADAEGDGDGAHEGGEGGHEDGTETGKAGVGDGLFGGFAGEDRVVSKVDHDDAVFHDDAKEKDDADEGVEREGFVEDEEGEQAAEGCRRQR